MPRRRTKPEFSKSPKNSTPVIRDAPWYGEIEHTRPIVDMMVLVPPPPMFEDRDFKHEKPFGFVKRGGKCVLLNLDTDKDTGWPPRW